MFIFLNKQIEITNPIIFSSIGATVPDILWGTSEFIPYKKILSPLNKLHAYFHQLSKTVVSLKTGLIIQLLSLVLTIMLILR